MNSSHENAELFRRALVEARLRKSLQATKESEAVSFSEQHLQNMRHIISTVPRSNRRSKSRKSAYILLVAAIITTVTVLISGLLIANREDISLFFDELFSQPSEPSYSNPSITQSAPHTQLPSEFAINYVPSGYQMTASSSDSVKISKRWEHESGEYIDFELTVYDGAIFDQSVEITEVIPIAEFEVYYVCSDQTRLFCWTDGNYEFKIECSSGLPTDEAIQMMKSIANQSKSDQKP